MINRLKFILTLVAKLEKFSSLTTAPRTPKNQRGLGSCHI